MVTTQLSRVVVDGGVFFWGVNPQKNTPPIIGLSSYEKCMNNPVWFGPNRMQFFCDAKNR
jgi:hypothetical protein